ncbi:MAG: hypothetical protein LBC27_06190 [Spirochaetaceae bacterium]|jgi:hypothetical protein|nr:hypothetical protein [Spirochaetaceae bacterium]
MKTSGIIIIFALLLCVTFTQSSFSQEAPSFSGVIPEILMRPSREQAPVYPVDAVIGQLGEGDVSAAANIYARGVLRDLMRQNDSAESLQNLRPDLLSEAKTKIAQTTPRKARLGGGREETDGSVSFLFRFIGNEKELSGELYIRSEENRWRLEDIIFEETQDLSVGSESFSSTYTPYERFY